MAGPADALIPDMMTALLYAVDGAVVSALIRDGDGPRRAFMPLWLM